MAGKFAKKSKKKSKLILVLSVLCVFTACMVIFLAVQQMGQQEETTAEQTVALETEAATETQKTDVGQETTDPLLLEDSGLRIAEVQKYTGAYMEDGSDEVLSNLLSVVLVNDSDQALQYAEFVLRFPSGDAEFKVSNLPAGAQAVLLESNRMKYTQETPAEFQLNHVAYLPEFEMYEDIFRVSGMDGVLNVKNISDKDIDGTISVFYKNKIKDVYYGGITYRAKIDSGLKAGEIRQITTKHFDPNNCEIVMVSYTG